MSLATVRPSSLPLPKTISHSSPIERFQHLRRNSKDSSKSRNLYHHHRNSLILPPTRTKLTSTSSCSSGSTPTYERQVKSLTPERDFALNNNNEVKQKQQLLVNNNEIKQKQQLLVNNNVKNNRKKKVSSQNSTTITVKTKGRDNCMIFTLHDTITVCHPTSTNTCF